MCDYANAIIKKIKSKKWGLWISMWIKCIRLYQFRNIKEQVVHLSPFLNIFIGENGHGKTNFAEAIYLLLKGDTFRYGDNKSFITDTKNESSLIANYEDNELQHQLKLTIEKTSKKYLINGKATSGAQIGLHNSVVLFSPESLGIIKSESQLRRSFIDDFILNLKKKEFYKIKNDYQKILKTKNKILKDIRDEKIKKEQGLLVLKSLEDSFLKLATEYSYYRIQELKLFLPLVNEVAAQIISETSQISVEYMISDENAMHYSFDQIYNKMKLRSLELHNAEIAMGHSLVGPQKHDVHFLVNNKDSRIFCSQGQQRALILAFKIAEVVYHKKNYDKYPLLVLDDVFSELDIHRRGQLMNFLESISAQSFITTTDEFLNNNFKLKERTSVIYVKEGTFNSGLKEEVTNNLL